MHPADLRGDEEPSALCERAAAARGRPDPAQCQRRHGGQPRHAQQCTCRTDRPGE